MDAPALARDVARQWGIELDDSLEDRADALMEWKPEWMQDRRNQLAMLDSFFSAVVPRKSLLFVYAKDVPLLENTPPGTRVLIGAGWVDQVDPVQEWAYSGDLSSWPLRSVLWGRAGHHSIRPSRMKGSCCPTRKSSPIQVSQERPLSNS